MDVQKLHRNRLIAIGKQEQALAWLIEHGPLVANPPLPTWALKSLVREERILRLRNGLYLVPRVDGSLPKLPEAIALVDPDGYISGHGALSLAGLNDQDIASWFSVTIVRKPDIRYGPFRVHFVCSPIHAQGAESETLTIGPTRIRMASPTQALVDEALFMPFGFDYVETLRVLRNAVESQRTTPKHLARILRNRPSVAVARRLGFLSEIATEMIEPDLLRMAQSNDGVTRRVSDTQPEKMWRLWLPRSRAAIARASR